jgi:hypothetical protein
MNDNINNRCQSAVIRKEATHYLHDVKSNTIMEELDDEQVEIAVSFISKALDLLDIHSEELGHLTEELETYGVSKEGAEHLKAIASELKQVIGDKLKERFKLIYEERTC